MERESQIFHELKEMQIRHETITKLKEKAEFKELEFTKQRRNLERIKEQILKITVIPFNNDTEKLNKEITEETLTKLLSNYFKIEELKKFFSITQIDSKYLSSKYDAITARNIDTNKLESFFISGYNFYSIIPNLAHEYTHGKIELASEIETVNFLGNYHYTELPSILIEQIVALESENLLNLPILKSVDISRIKHLKTIIEIEETLKKGNMTDEIGSLILEYQKHDTYKYLLSDILATALFEEYKKDKEKINYYIKKLLEHQITINEILTLYSISLKERLTVEAYEKKLKRVTS